MAQNTPLSRLSGTVSDLSFKLGSQTHYLNSLGLACQASRTSATARSWGFARISTPIQRFGCEVCLRKLSELQIFREISAISCRTSANSARGTCFPASQSVAKKALRVLRCSRLTVA